ncbi:hypothetical protein [Riemerella anatipestifer]|nr:hypothetical protein [Riemerella anatipestifer]
MAKIFHIGQKPFDKELIWTFPIQSEVFRIVGNIYENPKILE